MRINGVIFVSHPLPLFSVSENVHTLPFLLELCTTANRRHATLRLHTQNLSNVLQLKALEELRTLTIIYMARFH